MAELNLFHYSPGCSALHRRDPRAKLASAILLFFAVGFSANVWPMTGLTMVALVGLAVAELPLGRWLAEIRYVLLLGIVVAMMRGLGTPGTAILKLPFLTVTAEGVRSGIFFGWRLLLMVAIAILLTGTTPLSSLRDALEWFLRPIPGVPETRIAAMFNLTFAFIPLLLDQAAQITDAQRARCIDNRRNPLRRICLFVRPFLSHALLRAEETALAMESRCYAEVRTRPVFKADGWDWGLLGLAAVILAGVLMG